MEIKETKYFTYQANGVLPEKKIAQFLFTLPNKKKMGDYILCVGYIENENMNSINDMIENDKYICVYDKSSLESYQMGDECYYDGAAHFIFF